MKTLCRCVWEACFLVLLACAPVAGAESSPVSDALQSLKSGDTATRIAVVDRLGELGPKAARAVPEVTALLADADPMVRAHAAQTLSKIGSAAQSAVPALARLIVDPSEEVRREAATAIGAIQPDPQVAVPLLIQVIRDAKPSVRIRALHSLVELGRPAAGPLAEMLQDDELQYWAELGLTELGPLAEAAIPALINEIQDPHPDSRREAILALAAMGPTAEPAVGALTKALDDPHVRGAAAFALGRIGPAARPAAAKLEALSTQDSPLLKTVSLWALARIYPNDRKRQQEAVERLANALTNPQRLVREAAARALADLKPGPEIAMPAIRRALEHADGAQLTDALDALASLGAAAVPELIDALQEEPAQARVAYILGRIGPAAAPAVPALAKLVHSPNADVQREAIFALAKIGPKAAPAVKSLVQVFQDGQPEVRYGAAYALGEIGPAASAAKPALVAALQDSDSVAAVVSAWALAHIDAKCEAACTKGIPLLIQGLEDPEPRFRREAAAALACFGPTAKAAVPALKKVAAGDEDPGVREAATAALEAIGGNAPVAQ